MLARNNLKQRFRQQSPQQQRFTIKKLTVGVASVLIGMTYLGTRTAHADAVSPVAGSPIPPVSAVTAGEQVTPADLVITGGQSPATRPGTADQSQPGQGGPKEPGVVSNSGPTTPAETVGQASPQAVPTRVEATDPGQSAAPVATPDNDQTVSVNALQPYWIDHASADPIRYITNYADLKHVADVSWDLPQQIHDLAGQPGMIDVQMTIKYQDGTTTVKPLTFAAYTKSVILKFVDANTGQAFPMTYAPNIMDEFKKGYWGFVPDGGTFQVAPVEHPCQGIGTSYYPDKFIPIQPGYGIAKITKGSMAGPAVDVATIQFTEDPETYYVQLARIKNILVQGIDEAGHLLYQYQLPTDRALVAPLATGFYGWEGSQYTTHALTVPNYTLDQTPTNANGDLTGAPAQLQSQDAKTINVTYRYRFTGKDAGLRVTNPLTLQPESFQPGTSSSTGLHYFTNTPYDFTAPIQQAIQQLQNQGQVFLGEIGRNVGTGPYVGMAIQLGHVQQGGYQIIVKLDGQVIKTVPVTGQVGPTYDLTSPVNQVKAEYGQYQFTSIQGVPLTGSASPFEQSVILNYTLPTKTEEKVVTRTIKEQDPRTGAVKTVDVQQVRFSRQASIDPTTGQVVRTTDWHPVTVAAFTDYMASVISGYTPHPVNVADQLVTATTPDQEILITYTANPQTIRVIFQTASGQVISQQVVAGVTDQRLNLTDQTRVPAGYHLVGSDPRGLITLGLENAPVMVTVARDEVPGATTGQGTNGSGQLARESASEPPADAPTNATQLGTPAGPAGVSGSRSTSAPASADQQLPRTGNHSANGGALVGLGLLGTFLGLLGLKSKSD